MNTDLARWQFAFTSVNHFLFVPVTIGLAFLTAMLQTAWYRRRSAEYLRLTRFFGTLLVINVAIGVVTGLVQEFEFGMNWSAYSRLVGNVFGAPLAMEGLAAFFLESTFLGLWLFGWDKLSAPRAPGHDLAGLRSAASCRRRSSWRRTPGCSTRSATSWSTASRSSTTSGRCSPTRCSCGGTPRSCCAALVTGAAVMLAVSAWQLRHGGDRGRVTRSARLVAGRAGARRSCSPCWSATSSA